MKVSTRLVSGSGLVLLVLLGAMGYEVVQVRRLAEVARDLARSGIPAAQLALEQIHDLEELDAAARKAYVTRDADYAALAARLAGDLEDRQARLQALLSDPGERRQADLLAGQLRQVDGDAGDLLAVPDQEGFLAGVARSRDTAKAVLEATRSAMAVRARGAQTAAQRASRLSLFAALAALATGALVLAFTVRSIQRPLRRLGAATRAIAGGRFDGTIEAGGDEEFARLSADFNVMVRRLGELDQMKRDILAHVSHELKAPLAAMQESTRLLLEQVPGPLTADQGRLLELNLQSHRRLSAMIAKMLDLARLEAGVMEYDLKPRDLRAVLSQAADEMGPRAQERHVSLRLDLPPGPIRARCDEDSLLQALVNLLENAVKFSPPGGEVVLAAREAGPRDGRLPPAALRLLAAAGPAAGLRLITVADGGPGVPEDQRERIFERFHQGGKDRRRSEGGVGLGLAICREIVKAHGGTIWVEDRPGGGSLFALALPGVTPGAGLADRAWEES